jgi:hypothetical protein
MAVTYRPFRGKSLSAEWLVVLTAAAKEGVNFTLNSGHRTMAEQQDLVNKQGLFGPNNPHGAAFPSAIAPHIRVGRIDHALDVDAADGSAQRLAAWLRAKGAHPAFTIATEPWHIELPAADLRSLASTLGDPLSGYTEHERAWIREYDRLRRERRGLERRRELRVAMKRQRKRIWRAAQAGGWDHANRRARYRSLLARTT